MKRRPPPCVLVAVLAVTAMMTAGGMLLKTSLDESLERIKGLEISLRAMDRLERKSVAAGGTAAETVTGFPGEVQAILDALHIKGRITTRSADRGTSQELSVFLTAVPMRMLLQVLAAVDRLPGCEPTSLILRRNQEAGFDGEFEVRYHP
ncbi:hypothetical protein JW905_19110 [bacterium]|nr:hypothetical protein [candidate division CSSED10-310 bacterium]